MKRTLALSVLLACLVGVSWWADVAAGGSGSLARTVGVAIAVLFAGLALYRYAFGVPGGFDQTKVHREIREAGDGGLWTGFMRGLWGGK
jgi:hypothetical protein